MDLLFDLDGTLADPLVAFSGSLDFAFDALKLPRLSKQEMRHLIGPPLHLALPGLLGKDKASQSGEVLRLYRQHHAEIGIYRYEFYSEMDHAMKVLGEMNRLYVATSKPRVYAEALLRHFGKDHYFRGIYGSELSGTNSKKGDVIQLAMREHSLQSNQTVMIGDREHDVIGAKENGLHSIGVCWGYGSLEELKAAGANEIAENWDHLIALLTKN